jgi:hypothetical protein
MAFVAERTILTMVAAEIARALAEGRHAKDFVVTECKNGPTWFNDNMCRMDLVAIAKSWANPLVTAYEIKVSRQDFLSDTKWPQYLQYCDVFAFACPNGLIHQNEVKTIGGGVGLVYVHESGTVRTVVKPLNRNVPLDANFLMYILMNKVDPDRWPFHGNKIDYFRSWMADRKRNHLLGREIGTKMAEEIAMLSSEVRRLESAQRRSEVDNLKKELGVDSLDQLSTVLPAIKQVIETAGGVNNLRHLLRAVKEFKDETDKLDPGFVEALPSW